MVKTICVFGASRGTGSAVVEDASSQGYQVVAASRQPELKTVPDGVRKVRADVYDIDSVREALVGVDVVISTVGPSSLRDKTPIYSEGVMNIAKALAGTACSRLIVVDSHGVDPNPDLSFGYGLLMKFIARPLLGFAFRDGAVMEQKLRECNFDWTAVRVPMLVDGPVRGVRTSIGKSLHHGSRLGRNDLARYLLSIIDDPTTFRTWIEVAW
jgi:putative NADH-flavin reductase